ncbi:hypothetical protein ACFS5J_01795 [Flavobacterium chuncheonense]|uniref:Lipocalin-like domain-containing protein n=1 Tax=Flavobacterium chuncheonense TaxID=2026653 RepID=A0ABW5YI73_9FLAO
MKTKFILYAFLIVLFTACNDDDDNPCSDTVVTTASLETEYGCTETKYQMEIDLTDDFTVITNQTDFNTLVTGDCQPNIDFANYDLVIGKKGLFSGNTSINYEMIKDCETNNLTLTVTFVQNAASEAPNLTYHALIPKLTSGQSVMVEIELTY